MKVFISSKLPCDADRAFALVKKSSTLVHVAWPMAKIVPSRNSFPEQWVQGKKVYCKSYLFGIVPVGERSIYFERIDPHKREIQTRENDPLVQKWDHLISIKPIDSSSCIYADEIDIKAGLITFVVWMWAMCFYKHRQSRWLKLLEED
ncbi:MAG: hypothetical protein A4S09_06400 [Proteobacteria bacterium SG_bin7]|nr:MAG: hypothetical protein A4S09_06400 [Proteobacteria bacterium SG_bin7]